MAREDSERRRRAETVRARLSEAMPAPRTELVHADAWQLLVATILSAQSTDQTINRVTPELFDRWPGPAELASARPDAVQEVVRSTGFFRRKAEAIQGCARQIRDEHGGEVPRDIDALVSLPGVARKTANLVLGSAYGIASGIVVDTHARRVSQRLGLTTEEKPDKIERDLCRLWPPDRWIEMSHRLILHGRYVCTARSPDCGECPLAEPCPSAEAEPAGAWEARAAAERRRVGEAAG